MIYFNDSIIGHIFISSSRLSAAAALPGSTAVSHLCACIYYGIYLVKLPETERKEDC